MNGFVSHAAETGGGPTGFGWASFITFVVGTAGVLFMLGQYLKALYARRNRGSSGDATAAESNSETSPAP